MKKVIKSDWHRNGVGGEPFHVAIVEEDDGSKKLVVLFGERYYTAVFDLDLLARGVIEFGENSWRGDDYDDRLRDEIIDDFAYRSAARIKNVVAQIKYDRANDRLTFPPTIDDVLMREPYQFGL